MSLRYHRKLLSVFVILILLSGACSLPTMQQKKPTPSAPTDSAQATLDAMMTQIAGVGITTTPGIPTNTMTVPTTAVSSTPKPTATRVIPPTNTSTPVCDQAGFIDDISIPDGTVISAGTPFNKTWRLRNLGSCTWTSEYAVVFDSGSGGGMNASASQKIGASVPPGQYIDITVPMKAPGAPGQYRDYWKMRNAAGVLFGLGAANERFYVDIKVVSSPANGAGYDFAANLCLAQWTGNSKSLPCLGKDGSADGFVLYQAKPVLETGSIDDEPGLITNPPLVTDGVIRGKYPAYAVKANDRFVALLSCEYNAKKCNVRFQLDYQIDNGTIQTLGSWNEAHEGGFTIVDMDLSALAGKNVSFILTAFANGPSDQDRALWLFPRIIPKSPTPTYTATPTLTSTPTITPTPTITETEQAYPYPYP